MSAPTRMQRCPFTVQSMLQLRHKHILLMWTIFVDLDKALDSIDREVMFQILSKFGIPKSMIYVIQRLCNKNETKLSMGTEKGSIKNSIKVK
jgi:hypothetical protein